MNGIGFAQILLYFGVILAITKPLGSFMAKVFEGERTLLHPILRPLEVWTYRLLRIDEDEDQPWTAYAVSLLLFSVVGMGLTYALLRLQGYLPLNPQGFGAKEMPPDLAFNTAASFTTNTNWQAYAPESTVSYLSNMLALAIHNWMSAAAGMAVAVALIRGFARKSAGGIGNFWVDTIRSTIYVLFPLCLIGSVVAVAAGVPQDFSAYRTITTLEGAKQIIPLGAVASQEFIKMLGTNGGGVFNANSSHPFENPSNFFNFVQIVSIFAIPAGLTHVLGKMVCQKRQGWAVFAAMSVLFLAGAFIAVNAETSGTPLLAKAGVDIHTTADNPGGNMEGKEARFGPEVSALFATITTDASCGAVNSMHDSFTPIGGLVPLVNILSGEVIFGGVGAGMFGMLMFAVLAVFIGGLMVGRTPEFLGKKIGRFEVQMAMVAVLVLAASVLGFTALSLNTNYPPGANQTTISDQRPGDVAALPLVAGANRIDDSSPVKFLGATTNNTNNPGAHGFSEVLYAYASATGNNGSAFAGLTANTPHYNTTIGMATLIGRFLMIVPLLAMAGSLAAKKKTPVGSGTFATDGGVFVGLLVAVVLIVNALTYFPALALGPIAEQIQLHQKA